MIKIIYIAGDGRSGTTLLESILSNNESCIAVGECNRFWTRFVENTSCCGCGSPIRNCELWNAVHQRLSDEFSDYDPLTFQNEIINFQHFKRFIELPELLNLERWKKFSQIISAFYEAIAHFSKTNTIIDSSKSIPWARLLQLNDKFDVRVIHMERQLSQVAISWKKRIRLPEYPNSEVYMPIKSNSLILKRWLKVKLMARVLPKGGPYLFLQYERLCEQPEQKLIQIIKFAEIELDIENLSYQFNHAIGGNPMRYREQGAIEIRPSLSTNHNLSFLERLVFSLVNKLVSFVRL